MSGKTKIIADQSKARQFVSNHASELSIGVALLIICVVLSCLTPYFFQVKNFKNILSYVSIAGIMSAGLTVVMLMGCMDLSQYSVMAMIGMFVALMIRNGMNAFLVMIIALAIGLLVGCINAFVVTKMHVVPMIATIGMQLIARAIAYLSTGGQYLMVDNEVLYVLGYQELLGIPYTVWILLLVYAVLAFVLSNTSFGRKVFAVGGNPQACALAGIDVDKMKWMGYLITGFCAALASILYTAQVSASYPTAGSGQEMDCTAAIYLGGLTFGGGKGSVVGTFIGVLVLAVLLNGMTLLSVDSYYQILLKGVILIFAVYLDQARQLRKPKKKSA